MRQRDGSAPANPSRRRLFQAAGAAGAAAALPGSSPNAATASRQAKSYVFFNPAEAAFIEAAVARLIPEDETGPGATTAGVPNYIDKQLGGAWGAGARLYRSGPWQPGVPGQGYQLPYTPAELFRTAIRAINQKNPEFPALAPAQQDAFLASLQKGTEDLGGVPANTFFDSLLAITIEGFFSDPAYGGNRDMVAWKMIGFPGAYADYYELVDKHGIAYTAAPTSLEGGAARPLHVHLAKKGK